MKRFVSVLSLLLAVIMIFCSCGGDNGGNEVSGNVNNTSDTEKKENVIELIAGGEAKYGLVRSVSMSDEAVKACGALYNEIAKITGVSLQFVPDDSALDDGIKEILIGNTARKESAELAETLDIGEYAIKVVGDKIVIVSNEDETLTTAIMAFIDQCLKGASKGNWVVDEDLSIKDIDSIMAQKLTNRYIPKGTELVAKTTLLNEFSLQHMISTGVKGNGYVSVQGGCIAKGYLFTFLIMTNTHDRAWVVKTNIKNPDDWTVKELGTDTPEGEINRFGHCADAVYLPDRDVILISTGWPHSILVDPDTLEEVSLINTTKSYGAIAYDEILKQVYALDTEGVYFYDSDSQERLGTMEYEYSVGYKGQGMTCDGMYLYMLECKMNNKGNNLRVYDIRTGELVHIIDLGIAYETENIDYYDGAFYVSCNNESWSGSLVFKVEVSVK